MKKSLFTLFALAIVTVVALTPITKAPSEEVKLQEKIEAKQIKLNKVVAYLQNKKSPLSSSEVSLLVEQKHGDLLIALMGIESQFCKRQLGYNCFGVGGDSAYRHYNNFSESIIDADALITRWQERGRWLTVADMNGHYVQPYNPNWERVVNKILNDIKDF